MSTTLVLFGAGRSALRFETMRASTRYVGEICCNLLREKVLSTAFHKCSTTFQGGCVSRLRFSQVPRPPDERLLVSAFIYFRLLFVFSDLFSLCRIFSPLSRHRLFLLFHFARRRSTSSCLMGAPWKAPRKPWRRPTRGSVSSPCSQEQPCRTRDTSEEGDCTYDIVTNASYLLVPFKSCAALVGSCTTYVSVLLSYMKNQNSLCNNSLTRTPNCCVVFFCVPTRSCRWRTT